MPVLPPDAPVPLVFHEYGDAAVLVDVLGDDYPTRWSVAQSLGDALRTAGAPGLVDVVASYEHVFASFDPLLTDHATLTATVTELARRPPSPRPARHFVIPVVYGGDYGPDLAAVASRMSTTPEAIVDWHLSGDWVVRFVGSPLGAPMLDGPRLASPLPRLTQPRGRVEPGSVALSGFQSMIYNAPSPGGWQLIGRTPARLFELDLPPHVRYRAGDTVRFERIEPTQWDRHAGPVEPVGSRSGPAS